MEKEKKIKIFLGISYLLIITVFLWVFFKNYSIDELTSYDFIKNNRDILINFRNSNFFLISIIFLTFTIIWVMLLGFGTPVAFLAGFIFGKWFGTIITTFGLSLGATFLYIFANFFFKDIVEKKFSNKYLNLYDKFKKNEFIFFLIYRFIGGIPFFISNILPTLFNIRINNFFFGSLLGMMPQLFVWVSLGSGIEKIVNQNSKLPSFKELIFSSEIYLPISGFIILIIIGIFVKNLFFNK